MLLVSGAQPTGGPLGRPYSVSCDLDFDIDFLRWCGVLHFDTMILVLVILEAMLNRCVIVSS